MFASGMIGLSKMTGDGASVVKSMPLTLPEHLLFIYLRLAETSHGGICYPEVQSVMSAVALELFPSNLPKHTLI
jgi:hypothetical protein